MKLQFQQLLLVSLAFCGQAVLHIEDPAEDNVVSPNFCKTNPDGFGGKPINDEEYSESSYFYELTVAGQNLPSDATDAMIFEVEQRIADYLLSETNYFAVCGDRRRAKSISKPGLRRLQSDQAIAITINPPDEALDGVPCSGTVSAGQTCIVVEGAYRVYFADGAVATSSTMESMNADVEAGMDDDTFTGGNIVKITWLDELPSTSTGDQSNEADSSATVRSVNNDRNSTPAIVGASVGGILAIGLLAFYRRRNMKADDDTLTTPPGGSTA